jgi:hypothetical protein
MPFFNRCHTDRDPHGLDWNVCQELGRFAIPLVRGFQLWLLSLRDSDGEWAEYLLRY